MEKGQRVSEQASGGEHRTNNPAAQSRTQAEGQGDNTITRQVQVQVQVRARARARAWARARAQSELVSRKGKLHLCFRFRLAALLLYVCVFGENSFLVRRCQLHVHVA